MLKNIFVNLKEIQKRLFFILAILIINFLLCYVNVKKIYDFLVLPLAKNSDTNLQIIYTGLAEAFCSYLKIAIISALCITFPFIIWQIYLFIKPGLYKKEKKQFLLYAITSPILFIFGGLLAYYYVMPVSWKFFASFENSNKTLKFMPKMNEYLSLSISIIFAFGLAFQLPLTLILLNKINIIKISTLQQNRKIAIVIIFIVAAILTPPDVLSQIGLAIPLILLYELAILGCKFFNIKNTTKQNKNT